MPHEKVVSMPIFQSASVTEPDSGVLSAGKHAKKSKHISKKRVEPHPEAPKKHHTKKHRAGKHSGVEDGIHRVAEREHARHESFISPEGAKASHHGMAPSATTLTGMMGIIENPSAGRDRNLGIPGIISSTSLGPHERQRIVSGIIENPMAREADSAGPVHKVTGHDATAYNAGMVHIPGSRFR